MKKWLLLFKLVIILSVLFTLVSCNNSKIINTITTEYGDNFNIVQDGDEYYVQNAKTNGRVAYFRYKKYILDPNLIKGLYCSENIRCYMIGPSKIIFRRSEDDYYNEIDKFYLERLFAEGERLDCELESIIKGVMLKNKVLFNNYIQYFWDIDTVNIKAMLKDVVDGHKESLVKYGWSLSEDLDTVSEQKEIKEAAAEYLDKED